MSAVAQSFANIVKTNNGLFKSQAQAAFLLSQCQGNEFAVSGTVGRNGYTLFYTVDAQGVVTVKKQTVAKGLVVQWERVQEGQVAVQDAKEIKRLKRLIRQTEQSIAERLESFKSGNYPSAQLFAEAQLRDAQSLQTLNEMLAKLV